MSEMDEARKEALRAGAYPRTLDECAFVIGQRASTAIQVEAAERVMDGIRRLRSERDQLAAERERCVDVLNNRGGVVTNPRFGPQPADDLAEWLSGYLEAYGEELAQARTAMELARAANAWAEDTGLCHFCDYRDADRPHADDCPVAAYRRATEDEP